MSRPIIVELTPYRTTKPLAPNGHHSTVTVTFEWVPEDHKGPMLFADSFGFRTGSDVARVVSKLAAEGKAPDNATQQIQKLSKAIPANAQWTVQEVVHAPVLKRKQKLIESEDD